MLDWIIKHKWAVALICCLIFLLPLIIVHTLFQWDSHIPWLEAETWTAGEVLSYISGFMTLLGTIILGIITVKQSNNAQDVNKRLTEENLQLQKIMAQNLYPIVAIEDASAFATECMKPDFSLTSEFSYSKGYFAVVGIRGPRNSQGYVFDIQVNYDNDANKFKYKKVIEFSLCNLSSAVIRYISFERIHIFGNEGIRYLECVNRNGTSSSSDARLGCSTLLKQGDSLKGRITIFFNSEAAKAIWDNPQKLSGLGMHIYITNKSITMLNSKKS